MEKIERSFYSDDELDGVDSYLDIKILVSQGTDLISKINSYQNKMNEKFVKKTLFEVLRRSTRSVLRSQAIGGKKSSNPDFIFY